MSEDIKKVIVCHLVAAAELNKPRDQRTVMSCKSIVDADLDARVREAVEKGKGSSNAPEIPFEGMYLYLLLQSVAQTVSREDKQPYHGVRVVVIEGETVGQSMSHPGISLMVNPERLDDPYIRADQFVTPTVH